MTRSRFAALGVAAATALSLTCVSPAQADESSPDGRGLTARIVADAKTGPGTYELLTVSSVNGAPQAVTDTVHSAGAATRVVEDAQDSPKTLSVTASPKFTVATENVSNDNFRPYQWHLDTGKSEQIRLKKVRDVIVAVVDTGVDETHEDLAAGQILPGYNAVTGTVGPTGDLEGHGTAVAGVIAATANNGIGVAGVADAKILPVRIATDDGDLDGAALVNGIAWAVDHGAQVINMSIGTTEVAGKAALQPVLDYARAAGVVLIASSGNDGENKSPMSFPAGNAGVVGVGALNEDLTVAAYSTKNSSVDVAAPGTNIASLGPEDGYFLWDGTSFSSPYVAATVALGLSTLESSPSVATTEAALTVSAVDLGSSGRDTSSGAGFASPVRFVNTLHGAAVVAPVAFGAPLWGSTTQSYGDSRDRPQAYTASKSGVVDVDIRHWTAKSGWKTMTQRSSSLASWKFSIGANTTECARQRSVSMDGALSAWGKFRCDTEWNEAYFKVTAKRSVTLISIPSGVREARWKAKSGFTFTVGGKKVSPSKVKTGSNGYYWYTLKAPAKGSLVAKSTSGSTQYVYSATPIPNNL